MRYVFTGGGTLGHTNPAVAVAERVRQIDQDARILFIVREGGAENEVIRKYGFEIKEIPTEGLCRGGGIRKSAATFAVTMKAIRKCLGIIRETDADIIFGTGGYVSFAPLIAGILLGTPTYVHESNSTPGLVTKIVSTLGSKVLLNYEGAKDHFSKKKDCKVVGNPLLSDFGKFTKAEARKKLGIFGDEFFIVSFGGSGGSKVMNDTIVNLMDKRSAAITKIRHLHATGEKYFSDYRKRYPRLTARNSRQRIVARIEDMALYMTAADLLICRCGATTLSEISSVGRAAILIPSPNVTDEHQLKNGQYLATKEAAVLIEESRLTNEILDEKIRLLKDNDHLRKRLENNIAKEKKRDSAKAIAEMLINGK